MVETEVLGERRPAGPRDTYEARAPLADSHVARAPKHEARAPKGRGLQMICVTCLAARHLYPACGSSLRKPQSRWREPHFRHNTHTTLTYFGVDYKKFGSLEKTEGQ